jgi:hypothetical protein
MKDSGATLEFLQGGALLGNLIEHSMELSPSKEAASRSQIQ